MTNAQRRLFAVGAAFCALGVVLGAFGAHAFKDHLTPERLVTFETAVRYQMYAGFGIQLAALAGASEMTAGMLATGAAIFSGSLYLLCATDIRWLGAITPLGGLLMILAWSRLRARA